jgi:hypothetical protein
LNLVSNVNAAYERTILEMPDKKELVQTAQKNFIKSAVVLLYEYDHTAEAARWFNFLKNNFTNALIGDETNMTVEAYAFKEIQNDILELDPNKAGSFILGEIYQEYLCLIADDDDRAENFRRVAETVWQAYQKKLPTNTPENAQRIALPDMKKLRADELDQMEHQLTPQAAAYLRNKLRLPPRAPAPPPPNPTPPAGGGRT